MRITSEYLKALRVEAGLTQTELGDRIGFQRSMISRVEHGFRDLKTEDLIKWVEACGYEVLIARPGDVSPEVETWPLGDEERALLVDLASTLPEIPRSVRGMLRAQVEHLLQEYGRKKP